MGEAEAMRLPMKTVSDVESLVIGVKSARRRKEYVHGVEYLGKSSAPTMTR